MYTDKRLACRIVFQSPFVNLPPPNYYILEKTALIPLNYNHVRAESVNFASKVYILLHKEQ